MSSTFRSHDCVPNGITSLPIFHLLQEWVELNSGPSAQRAAQELGFLRPSDVVDRLDQLRGIEQEARAAGDELARSRAYEDQNQLLLRLIVGPGYLARRILLQAFLPKLFSIASRRTRLSATLDEHVNTVVGDFWAAIDTYPIHRTKHVAMELLRGTYDQFQPDNTVMLPLEEIQEEQSEEATIDPAAELNELLTNMLDQGIISSDDLSFITRVHLQNSTSAQVAAQLGTTASAVRKRAQRIRERIAAAAV